MKIPASFWPDRLSHCVHILILTQFITQQSKGVRSFQRRPWRVATDDRSKPARSLSLSQGWGLIDLLLRASNEGLLRPRVARAEEIIRLLPLLCSASRRRTRLLIVPLER